MEVTLLLPQGLNKRFSLYQARGSATSTFTVTRQPRLSTWTENTANNFLRPKRACFSVLLRTRELHALFSLLEMGLSTLLPRRSTSAHELLPFFPSSARLRGSESPTHGQVWKPYRWVPCPISSLTLEEGFPTTSLLVIHLWVRGLFWV
jgi:hypothetical protein